MLLTQVDVAEGARADLPAQAVFVAYPKLHAFVSVCGFLLQISSMEDLVLPIECFRVSAARSEPDSSLNAVAAAVSVKQ